MGGRSRQRRASARRAGRAWSEGGDPARRLASLAWERPEALVAVLGGLLAAAGAVLTGLGYLCHRAREALLIPGIHLEYSPRELLAVGWLASVRELTWALLVLLADDRVLLAMAWGLVALGAVLIAVVGQPGQLWRPAALLVVLICLGVSSVMYTIAVRADNPVPGGPGGRAQVVPELTGSLSDRLAFETWSWLYNDTDANRLRRRYLAGLWPWLLATVVAGTLASWRSGQGRPWRGYLVVLYCLVAAFLLGRMPEAYAYANWGHRYKRVIGLDSACSPELAQAIADGCCAFDVAQGRNASVLLIHGRACPGALRGWRPVRLERTERCRSGAITYSPSPPAAVFGACETEE